MSLSSFDELVAERSVVSSGDTSMLMDSHHVCSIQSSMCFAVEGIMTTLFTPPGFDWTADGDSGSDNSLVDEQGRRHRRAPPTLTKDTAAAEAAPIPAISPRKVCNLWKKKRKAEKRRVMAMREEAEDHELYSELKQSALHIQRSFERSTRNGEDSDEEQHRSTYEKYGSRAEFIRDNRL